MARVPEASVHPQAWDRLRNRWPPGPQARFAGCALLVPQMLGGETGGGTQSEESCSVSFLQKTLPDVWSAFLDLVRLREEMPESGVALLQLVSVCVAFASCSSVFCAILIPFSAVSWWSVALRKMNALHVPLWHRRLCLRPSAGCRPRCLVSPAFTDQVGAVFLNCPPALLERWIPLGAVTEETCICCML